MQRRRGIRTGRLRAVGGAVALTLLALQVVFSAASSAAGGTWGAGAYPYVAGAVCSASAPDGVTSSSPLAAWDLGDGSLGYLTSAPTSDGTVDSGAPPLASVGTQTRTPIAVGRDGFTSVADIGVYARLLSSAAPNDVTAATIAKAVLTKTSVSGSTEPALSSCAGDPAALLSSAAALAGPYKLTLRAPGTALDPGATGELVATVLSAAGHPVPGMVVSGTTTAGPIADVTTDEQGQAKLAVTVPTGTTSPSFAVTASVSAPIGLAEVSATANPTASNPTALVATALTTDAPITVTVRAAVPVMLSADPSITAAGDHTGLAFGAQLTPQAVITGMHGHSANVTFTIYGPLKPPASGACTEAKFKDSSPVAASTTGVTTTGDQTLHAGSWAPTEVGCYLVRAALATTDATPAASADSGFTDPLATVAVVDLSATLSATQTLAGAGPLAAKLTIAGAIAATGSITGALSGPVRPGDDGSCAGVDFAKAPSVAVTATKPGQDGSDPAASQANLVTGKDVSQAGCYQWHATVALTVGPGSTGIVSVPADVATGPVLLLAPTIRLASSEISTTKPNPVSATVTVTGLYQQAAHVSLQMHYAAASLQGCRDAEWGDTAVAASGPPTELPTTDGVLTSSVSTGELKTMGCWLPVAVLTVDDNPSIKVLTPITDVRQAILAGVDPHAKPLTISGGAVHTASWKRIVVAAGSLAALELVVVASAVLLAWRSRRRQVLAGAPLEIPGTLPD